MRMKNTLAICRREILSFFVSPVAYFVIAGFVVLAGYFFFNLLGIFSVMFVRYQAMASYNPGAEGPNLNQWVVEPFYFTLVIILVFLTPVLTMRLLAEERKRGTFELLITSPLSVLSIVLGKFLGVAVVLFVMCGLCFAFPLLLVYFGDPGPELNPILSGWLGLFLCSLAFASVSLAVSAFTENQIVAAVSGIVTLLLLYVIHSPAETMEGPGAAVLKSLSPVLQMQDFVRGVISLQSITYFVALIVLGLFLSQRALDAHRWR